MDSHAQVGEAVVGTPGTGAGVGGGTSCTTQVFSALYGPTFLHTRGQSGEEEGCRQSEGKAG